MYDFKSLEFVETSLMSQYVCITGGEKFSSAIVG